MSRTHQQILTVASSPTDVAVALANLQEPSATTPSEPGYGFGEMLRSLFVPGFMLREDLDSQDTHVEDRPGLILAVLDEAGANELVIEHVAGSEGAGDVSVVYDADGVATLVFGDGACTGYQVLKIEAPVGIADKLAALFR